MTAPGYCDQGSELSPETPLGALIRLAGERATGELVIASDRFEAHVFLVGGRVAWSTSTSAPNALARYLVETCGVDPAAIRATVEHCRSARRRFGEVLVERKVATTTQVRCALEAQIVHALASLETVAPAHTLFLPARVEYDQRLTFALDDLLEQAHGSPASQRLESFVDSLLAFQPELLWIDVLDDSGFLVRGTNGAEPPEHEASRRLHAFAAAVGAESVVVRSAFGCIVGQRLEMPGLSAWGGLRDHSRLGLLQTILATFGSSETRSRATMGRGAAAPSNVRSIHSLGAGLVDDPALTTVFDESAELMGVVVQIQGDRCGTVVTRPELSWDTLFKYSTMCDEQLDLDLSLSLPRTGTESTSVYERLSIHVTFPDCHTFATRTDHTSHPILVAVATRRRSPRGLGWVLLDALARRSWSQ